MLYVYLAIGCVILGTVFTLALFFTCQHLGIDIQTHLWLLAIPIALALLINISILELYDRFKRK